MSKSNIENFNPPYIIEKLANKVYESVAEAFLDKTENGKDYVVRTDLVKEDWADGYGTKYTYSLDFEELVRCRDCAKWATEGRFTGMCVGMQLNPDGFCAWAERRKE